MNAGSYERIPLAIRAIVNREFEAFVYSEQLATENGFRVSMWYVALTQ